MKLKTLILAAGLVTFVSCGPSYRVTDASTGVTVPAAIEKSFSTQYPTAADITWSGYDANNLPIDWDLAGWQELKEGDYVARFNLDSDQYYAWYDENGNWIGSAYVLNDYTSLPEAVTSMIKEKFAGYTITSVNNELQKEKRTYEIQLKNGDSKAKLLVDANGNIIKQKTVTK